MSRLNRILFIGLIFALMYSTTAGGDAVAAPEEAPLAAPLTLTAPSFQADFVASGDTSFTRNFRSLVAHEKDALFYTIVKFPIGSTAKKVTLSFIDNDTNDICLHVYVQNFNTGASNIISTECSTGSNSGAVLKLKAFGFTKVVGVNKAIQAVVETKSVSDDHKILGVRGGYLTVP
ncbi:MAG: hypothetical protein N2D54_04010 [Chloroflexota bacterium]